MADGIEGVEILSVHFHGHVLTDTGHELIGAQLHGLTEGTGDAGNLGEPGFDLGEQFFLVLGCLPLALVFFQDDKTVGEVHSHRIVGHRGHADASANGLYLGKLFEQHALHFRLPLHGL